MVRPARFTRGASTASNRQGFASNRSAFQPAGDQGDRLLAIAVADAFEERYGFQRVVHDSSLLAASSSSNVSSVAAALGTDADVARLGWLLNVHETLLRSEHDGMLRSAVDLYLLRDDGSTFKCTRTFQPYFYVVCKPSTEHAVEDYLRRGFECMVERTVAVGKEDLVLPNHLVGHQRRLVQVFFNTQTDLMVVRKALAGAVKRNASRGAAVDAYETLDVLKSRAQDDSGDWNPREDSVARSVTSTNDDPSLLIIAIHEYDLTLPLRVAIDLDIRIGLWYDVHMLPGGEPSLALRRDKVKRADPVVLAFDIETTKLPLKFPDAAIDQIMMISYMIDGQGYLITNREIVAADINDFEYTPKPEYEGVFHCFNAADEMTLLRRFFDHIMETRPAIFVTYNGDFFDWPFVEARAKVNGLDMLAEIGFAKDNQEEYKSRHAIHMDCFRWVKRDSYLPAGSHGLKAVTRAKLGYDPAELDPEDMTRFASEDPQTLAQYSVSDAVATYYLYYKYVHPFIFSLCNIIPLNPDDVLRKGSGTLCEMLLMVEAFKANVLMPNKHEDVLNSTHEGHLLESETYVGGHVEALEAGVFRSDLSVQFRTDPKGVQQLHDEAESALRFAIEVEEKQHINDVVNYEHVLGDIRDKLADLRDRPMRSEKPLIYHLDVAAMYPNIILTNRLQPDAMVDEGTCASCDFNLPGKVCDRRMNWSWRGQYYTAKRGEVAMIRRQLESETFPGRKPHDAERTYSQLGEAEQDRLLRQRLAVYSRKVYSKVHTTTVMDRESIVCQRENPFYIDTVRSFRDRRYEYKALHKKWKQALDAASASGDLATIEEAKALVVVFDSLQLAHKCILNSFYGYVMRKGARWYSMEMAGIVCLTGASIIQKARKMVDYVGRPLELDTDGIWCMLPSSFPENYKLQLRSGKTIKVSYPCVMLNYMVSQNFTNHQYQELRDADKLEYETRSENSIGFEVDGPYRAMILPSSTEEDKLLKKRYAVFNDDGSLAELKGFEIKRRGELKLIKTFQSQIFSVFLDGSTLQECYAAAAAVANRWLDVLFSKASTLHDQELVELISENRSMSRSLEDYGEQRSTSISTAKRLAEFLGDQMVKDKGLACKFIISARPTDLSVSERAIPVVIFSAEPAIMKHYLRKWLKDPGLQDFDIRSILDWDYYLQRLGSVIQKIITIPAAMQNVPNPVPRVPHPDWMKKRVTSKTESFRQKSISDVFKKRAHDAVDMEDLSPSTSAPPDIAPRSREEVCVEPAADPRIDYSKWIAQQKPLWKKQRAAMKPLLKVLGPRGVGRMGLARVFQRRLVQLASTPWSVLQVAPSSNPGEYQVWALIAGKLESIRVDVPRIIYLNCRTDFGEQISQAGITSQLRTCKLPRSHRPYFVYELTMSESVFRDKRESIMQLMSHPDIAGVYETQVPLATRALLQIGCSCKVSLTSLATVKADGFHLDNLEPAETAYLTDVRLGYVYLFHATSGDVHLLALFFTALAKAAVFVVAPGDRQPLPNMSRLYSEKLSDRLQTNQSSAIVDYAKEVEFVTSYYRTDSAAYAAVSQMLSNHLHEFRQPQIAIVQSPFSLARISSLVKPLAEMPYCVMPARVDDTSFSGLGWRREIALRLVEHYLGLGDWIQERLDLARYANVPVCNLGVDAPLFLADLFFARRLFQHGHVLWWSHRAVPDLGGVLGSTSLDSQLSSLQGLHVDNSSFHRRICIDIDVHNLAVNTVLESAIVNEFEGSAKSLGYEAGGQPVEGRLDFEGSHLAASEDDLSPATFDHMRAMLKSWQALATRGDLFAELLVRNFYRWITSPSTGMYEPKITSAIHEMMRKVFSQLAAELKRLGANLVSASYDHIIIATSKNAVGNAKAYVDYILKALVDQKPLFRHLRLETVTYYENLLWLDRWNFGGVRCKNPDAVIGTDGEGAQRDLAMRWTIADYLPPALQQDVSQSLAEVIYQAHLISQKSGADALRRVRPADDEGQEDESRDPVAADMRTYVRSTLSRKLLKILQQAEHAWHHRRDDADWQFPRVIGLAQYDKEKELRPALEFTKVICKILALDRTSTNEMRVVRRNMLSLLGQSEFSESAVHKARHTSTVVLTRWICEYCQYCRDLDFSRDASLKPQQGATDQRLSTLWRCTECGHVYDENAVEESLVDLLSRTLTAYQLQDVQCERCRLVRAENVSTRCPCSGNFVNTERAATLQDMIAVMVELSESLRLRVLGEYAGWVRQAM